MNKRMRIISGMVVLVLLLASAAFIGGRLLNGLAFQLPNGQLINFGFGGAGAKGCDITRVVAPELPGPPMMRRAVLVRRQGNSIFIGIPLQNVTVNPGGIVSQTNSYDGPIMEVVVTHDTKVYQDITFQNYNGTCGQVQQVVAPGNLNDIVEGTTFLVWGQRNSNRILASNLVYELPLVTKPGAGK